MTAILMQNLWGEEDRLAQMPGKSLVDSLGVQILARMDLRGSTKDSYLGGVGPIYTFRVSSCPFLSFKGV